MRRCCVGGEMPPAGCWEVAAAGPLIERRRHPAQVAVAGEGPQEQSADAAEDTHRAWIAGHPGESRKAIAGAALPSRPFERATGESFLPAQMQKDARDVDFHWTDVAACAA